MYNTAKSITISIFTLFTVTNQNIFAGGAVSCSSKAQTKIIITSQQQSSQQMQAASAVPHIPSLTIVNNEQEAMHNHDRDDEKSQSRTEVIIPEETRKKARALPLAHARAVLITHRRQQTHALISSVKGHRQGPSLERRTSLMVKALQQREDVKKNWPKWVAEDDAQQKGVHAVIAAQEAENQRTARARQEHRARGGSDADEPQSRVVDVSKLAEETDEALEQAEQVAIKSTRKTRMSARNKYTVQTP